MRGVPPIVNNYYRFIGVVKIAAKCHIPRGYRREYKPCWADERHNLYIEYQKTGKTEIANKLLFSLAKSRKNTWIKTMEKIDFRRSSKKASNLQRRLEPTPSIIKRTTKITPKIFANRIIEMSRSPLDKISAREVTMKLRIKKSYAEERSRQAEDFRAEEVQIALKSVKLGKAAELDCIYPEFLKHCSPNTMKVPSNFFTDILHTGRLANIFKKTKVLTVLKPDKPDSDVKSYRHTSLLST